MKLLNKIDKESVELMLMYYYSFVFSRHPHDRLLSLYLNKFKDQINDTVNLEGFDLNTEHGTTMIDKEIMSTQKSTGHAKVNFEQFIRYVLQNKSTSNFTWKPQIEICNVCTSPITYIGKYESISQDARVVLSKLNLLHLYKTFIGMNENIYTKETRSILKDYYKQLPTELLSQIYEYYKGDFEAFGYDPYYYISY